MEIDVPGPVPAPPTATVTGQNVVSLSWTKPNYTGGAPVTAYKVEAWLLGEGAMWTEVRKKKNPSRPLQFRFLFEIDGSDWKMTRFIIHVKLSLFQIIFL